MSGLFIDRRDAGRRLAEKIAGYSNRPDVLVLALPRGGVPVAYEGSTAERKRVRPASPGSYEGLFHAAARDRFLLIMNDRDAVAQQLRAPRLERAIGVIYRPETERQSHYFRARLPDQLMWCCISMKRAPSSLSKPPKRGKPANFPRHSHSRFEAARTKRRRSQQQVRNMRSQATNWPEPWTGFVVSEPPLGCSWC